ncbi:MAG: CBS domain-containing protein [Trueperaceae bacterium]|nr:CBS domain-containing protein [Trueperaceae bacterium]
MLVRDAMTADPTLVSTDTPMMEAMQRLREGGYRRLPVVDGDRLVGIVTDRDLKEAAPSKATTLSVYELNYLLAQMRVRDVMREPVITVRPSDPIERAALLMEEHRISGLPVVDGDRLVGIVTITDLLHAFVGFLGIREGGTRVTVEVPDEPGVLARAARAAAPSNIVAAVTAGVEHGHVRSLVLRVTGQDAAGFPDRLKAEGISVTDVR